MFTRWLLLVLSGLFMALPVQAQEYEWKVLYYDYTQINVLTARGVVETIPVPDEAQGITQFSGLDHMQLSPDQRYLLFVKGEGNVGEPQMASLQIADLMNQTCCDTIQAPEGMVVDTITIGPFNPDGTQVAVNFATVYSGPDLPSILATVDLETNSIVQSLDLKAAFEHQGAFLHDWTEEGISLFSTCLACGGVIEGYYSRWNPETGEITPDVYYVNWLGDRLWQTGEVLVPLRDESRPVSNDDGMFPPNNVIEYLPDGDPENAEQVYFNPDMLNLPHPYWVQNGAAYLLHNWAQPTATLVHRDGISQTVDLPADLHFVTATPDGWLMQRNEAELVQFQVTDDGGWTFEILRDAGGPVVILEAPPLGVDDAEPVHPILG